MTSTIYPVRRLIVANADPEDREQTVRALAGLGHDIVAQAPSGLEAIEAAARHRPDLVLVDVTLPGALDGPGTARAIDEICGIPAVVVGAEDRAGVAPVSDSVTYGVLPKPFGHRELQATIEDVFRPSTATVERVPDRPPSAGHQEGFSAMWNGGGTRYRRLFRHGPAGAFEATLTGEITEANSALAKLLGYHSRCEMLGSSLADLVPEAATYDRVLDHAREGREIAGEEVHLRTKGGREVIVLLCTKVMGSPEDGGRVVGTVMDITERKRHGSDLRRLAFEDPLTGLANRRALEEHGAKYLALAERHGLPVGVIYLDLSQFREVNDRFGHPAGDDVLVEVARRLEAGARETDVISRVGGDEFVALLPDVEGLDAVVTVARRMKRMLEDTPIDVKDGQTTVRAEMGASVFPEHGSCLEDLVRAADRAMYRAKATDGDDPPHEEAGDRRRVVPASRSDRPSSTRSPR